MRPRMRKAARIAQIAFYLSLFIAPPAIFGAICGIYIALTQLTKGKVKDLPAEDVELLVCDVIFTLTCLSAYAPWPENMLHIYDTVHLFGMILLWLGLCSWLYKSGAFNNLMSRFK